MQDYDIPITNALTVPQSCTKPSISCAYDLGMEFSVLTGPDDVCMEWVPFIFHLLPFDDSWRPDSYSLGHLITLVFVTSVQSSLYLWIRMMYWCISLVWVSPGIHLLHYSTWWDQWPAVVGLTHAVLRIMIIWAKNFDKNIERHTVHTIVSWPNPKQWVIVHTSDLMMIIRQSIYILSIITREVGKLKTHSHTYCIMDNWENMLNLTHSTKYIWQAFYKFNVFR